MKDPVVSIIYVNLSISRQCDSSLHDTFENGNNESKEKDKDGNKT